MVKVVKEKRYECDFYKKGCDIPYKTTRDMPWSGVLNAKRVARLLGEKVVHRYVKTYSYSYEV